MDVWTERAREPRESVGVHGVLTVLRGGNMKTKLTGSPRYYWVVSRMCMQWICLSFLGGDNFRESEI